MEWFKAFQYILAINIILKAISANAQITTPCTASMISSFSPCLSFITGSSGNGSSPTPGCCSSLKSLMSTSMDCACLIFAANVPVQLPINQTLAISLPRACSMGGVPVQCKASGSPLPAPGPIPILLGPSLPPAAASPFSPQASKAAAAQAPAPQSETPQQLTPASPPVESEVPTATPGIRPVLTPSASNPSYAFSPAPVIFLGFMIFMCY